MTLGQKQRKFTRMVADLIVFAYEQGYELTLGDAFRDSRVHGPVGQKKSYSSANSLHKERLAIDLNLFRDGRYLTSSEDHKPLGEYWKSLHPDCRWGGDFKDRHGRPRPDGNHYSLAHDGRA